MTHRSGSSWLWKVPVPPPGPRWAEPHCAPSWKSQVSRSSLSWAGPLCQDLGGSPHCPRSRFGWRSLTALTQDWENGCLGEAVAGLPVGNSTLGPRLLPQSPSQEGQAGEQPGHALASARSPARHLQAQHLVEGHPGGAPKMRVGQSPCEHTAPQTSWGLCPGYPQPPGQIGIRSCWKAGPGWLWLSETPGGKSVTGHSQSLVRTEGTMLGTLKTPRRVQAQSPGART